MNTLSFRDFALRLSFASGLLGVVIFGAVRLAIARDGVAGGPARTSVTVSGTLTGPGVSGTPLATFHFRRSRTLPDLCAPTAMIPMRDTTGAFSVDVPLDQAGAGTLCPDTLFNGSDVFVSVDVGEMRDLVPAQVVNPVPYAHYASVAARVPVAPCPEGYSHDPTASGITLCTRRVTLGTVSITDEVVRVGTGGSAFWIDRFEARIFTRAGTAVTPADSRGLPGLPRNGQWWTASVPEPPLLALSQRGDGPSANMTWFQANELCAASGKRLPTGDEWLRAAQGTLDDANCKVSNTPPGARATNADGLCRSRWGAQDMIGNLWEWTSEWYASIGRYGFSTAPGRINGSETERNNPMWTDPRTNAGWPSSDFRDDVTANISSAAVGDEGPRFGVPSAAFRGGGFGGETGAGVFALNLGYNPTGHSGDIGIRCVIPR